MNKSITVFTPSFNRKEYLKKCYESLVQQTSKDFVWLIIDDGSTDNTHDLVVEWMSIDKISIEYVFQENSGKAAAINKSLEVTKTELWMCLDSDDYLKADAIEVILDNFSSVRHNESVCGLFSLRADESGQPMQGTKISSDIVYATQSQIRYDLKIKPEYCHVFKTKVIKMYPYPLIPGEKYFPLSYVFDKIDQKYKYKIIHYCFMVCSYLDDGMTKNKRFLIAKYPLGYMLYKRQLIDFAPGFIERCKAASTYVTACILSGRINVFKDCNYKFIVGFCYPVGFLDYFFRYRKYKILLRKG